MTQALPVPAVVIGGYLGAGKTTLVNHLLRHAGGRRIAVLVNDFGEVSIDADLIEGADGGVLSLAGGCVCCSFGDDLVGTLQKVIARDPRPDVLLIETSGVGLPASVARTARLVRELAVDAIVVVADAPSLRERAADRYVGDTVLQQLREADLLLLNQLDRLDPGQRPAVLQQLADPAWGLRAAVVECEHAQVPVDLVLGWRAATDVQVGEQPVHRRPWDAQTSRTAPAVQPFAPRPLRPHVAASERFESGVREFAAPVDIQALVAELVDPTLGLVRAKGLLIDQQGQRVLLQQVGSRITVSPASAGAERVEAGSAASAGRLVWIRRKPG